MPMEMQMEMEMAIVARRLSSRRVLLFVGCGVVALGARGADVVVVVPYLSLLPDDVLIPRNVASAE